MRQKKTYFLMRAGYYKRKINYTWPYMYAVFGEVPRNLRDLGEITCLVPPPSALPKTVD